MTIGLARTLDPIVNAATVPAIAFLSSMAGLFTALLASVKEKSEGQQRKSNVRYVKIQTSGVAVVEVNDRGKRTYAARRHRHQRGKGVQ